MKRKYILLTSIASLLILGGCSSETEVPITSVDKGAGDFSDEVVASNMELLLDGFTLTGTVTQTRYYAEDTGLTDEYGDDIYNITDEVYETNTYYTNVMYDNRDQNRFYKYSYREYAGVEIAAEGPYTYYEDEEGYAYTASVNYTNRIIRSYALNNGRKINFAESGFYNFFSIFNDNDITLDEERSGSTITYYNISDFKANIIADNIMYSLNSGAYSTIDEAYITCVNGVFTQLYIDLTAIQASDLDEVTYIDNVVTFIISDMGQTVIEEPDRNEDTDESLALDAVLDTYEDNFTIDVTYDYTYSDLNSSSADGSSVDKIRYYYTGDEIYVHKESSDSDTVTDYYLAPLYDTSDLLYPYGYDTDSGEWIGYETGYWSDASTVVFASAYCGYYTYDDLLPMVADISGTVFTYDSNDNEYDALYDVISEIVGDDGFMVAKRPFLNSTQLSLYQNISTLHVSIEDEEGIEITAGFSYTDYNMYYRYGNVTIKYSNVGTTTLPATPITLE